jgi:hypothetical protein
LFLEFFAAVKEPRFDGAAGEVEGFGDFAEVELFEIEEAQDLPLFAGQGAQQNLDFVDVVFVLARV